MGIPVENWKVVLHGNKSTKLLEDVGIKYEVVENWSSDLKTGAVNKFILTLKNGWLIHPDLDEFFDYGTDLESTIKMCEETGVEVIEGEFAERVSEDLEIKPISEEELFKTFPRDATKEIWRKIPPSQSHTKIMLLKITEGKSTYYKGCHTIHFLETFKVLDKKLVVNHFRWSEYAKMTIRKKLYRYASLNMLGGCGQQYTALSNIVVKKDDKYYVDL